MSIAGRFGAALDDADDDLAGPELLPVRLSLACARTLAVDGAGLSVLDASRRRIPLGASSATAAVAERAQFTAGSGPCQAAQEHTEPVFATSAELRRRWPAFARLLVEQTPYRGVVALPLGDTPAGPAVLDLLFVDDSAVTALDVFEAVAVGAMVVSALRETAAPPPDSPQGAPAWLQSPAAQRRAAVWTAIGRLSMATGTDAPAALDLLRGAAWAADRTVDDLAEDVVSGRLDPADLRPHDEPPSPHD